MSLTSITQLGRGTYGSVTAETIAVKTSNISDPPRYLIGEDIVMETSILHHLNRPAIQNKLEYNPFPELYSVESKVDHSRGIITKTRMSYVGGSMSQIMIGLEREKIIELIESQIDNILDCLRIMHSNGVIHNDLSMSNILIDDQGRVHIIDFGFSQINNLIDDYVNGLIPGGTSQPSSDLWMLAGFFLISINRETVRPDVDWAVEKLLEAYPEISEEELTGLVYEGKFDKPFPVDEDIPSSLRERLQTMLNINPRNRNYKFDYPNTLPRRLPADDKSILKLMDLSDELNGLFHRTIVMLLRKMDSLVVSLNLITLTNILVAINLLCRWFYRYGKNDNRYLLGNIIAIIFLSLNNSIHKSSEERLITSHFSMEEIGNYQIKILKVVDWKIFTASNSIKINGNVRKTIRNIIEDPDLARYLFLSDQELAEKVISMLERS